MKQLYVIILLYSDIDFGAQLFLEISGHTKDNQTEKYRNSVLLPHSTQKTSLLQIL
jgi:hypothetical protein